MKRCPKCKETKEFSEFHKGNKNKDGLASYCKICAINRAKESNKSNPKKHQECCERIVQEIKIVINNIRIKYGCSFCNENDPCCLDFHHKNPKVKDGGISAFIRHKSKTKLIKEVNKCIVVCANCHRKIHSGKLNPENIELCNENYESHF